MVVFIIYGTMYSGTKIIHFKFMHLKFSHNYKMKEIQIKILENKMD